MVGVKSRGRLGNQMFQYAFVSTYSQRFSTPYFIDKFGSLKYFKCYNEYRVNNFIQKSFASILFLKGRLGFIVHTDKAQAEFPTIQNNCIFVGFFQSKIYFEDNISSIRNSFEIRKKYRSQKLFENYSAIHMRFGDYKNLKNPNLGNDISLKREYFLAALQYLKNESGPIVVVSDDLERSKQILPNSTNFIFHKGSEIEDFQILSKANNLIISNSTFAWWAAFLNQDAKIVIAPKYWMGVNIKDTYPPNIFEQINWTILEY